jgi:HNH endonuclease
MNNLKETVEQFTKYFNEIGYKFYEERRSIDLNKKRKWNDENREKLRDLIKKYDSTDRVKEAHKRYRKVHNRVIKEHLKVLSKIEIQEIRDFYFKCPIGYEVDHIIPISKGGKHCKTNLQYLTPEENKKKSNRLDYKVVGANPT